MALLDQVADLIAWMGWYILPFIAIMSAIVFFHELGHYVVGAVVRRQNRGFFAGLRSRTLRPGRQAWHALAARRASARRIRQIPRRRQRGQHAGRRLERPER